MDDLQQNAIRIEESIDLHLKYALRWYIKFKSNYTFDSHQKNWKRLQLECEWKPMIKINTLTFCFFRSSEYEPDYMQNFGSTKYVAVYAGKTYSITLDFLELLLMLLWKYIHAISWKYLRYINCLLKHYFLYWIKLYMTGGFMTALLCNKKLSDIIYSYYVNSRSNEMTEFDVKLPFVMFGMNAFITKSQRYLIIVGGSYCRMNIKNWPAVSNGIYVLNLNTMIWSKSNVKLPKNEKYNSMLIDMDKNSKVFLVQAYNTSDYRGNICNEITQLIASFYCGEMIHIVESVESETPTHYKISVDNLIISR